MGEMRPVRVGNSVAAQSDGVLDHVIRIANRAASLANGQMMRSARHLVAIFAFVSTAPFVLLGSGVH